MPWEVFVRGGKNATDQARRSWVDVAVCADETGRDRAHPSHDPCCTSIATATRRRHRVYIVCESAMKRPIEQRFDLSAAKATALEVAQDWGLVLGEPFALSYVSYVDPRATLCSRSLGKGTQSRCTRATRSSSGTATERCDFCGGRGAPCSRSVRCRGTTFIAARRRGDRNRRRRRLTAVAPSGIAVPAGYPRSSAVAR